VVGSRWGGWPRRRSRHYALLTARFLHPDELDRPSVLLRIVGSMIERGNFWDRGPHGKYDAIALGFVGGISDIMRWAYANGTVQSMAAQLARRYDFYAEDARKGRAPSYARKARRTDALPTKACSVMGRRSHEVRLEGIALATSDLRLGQCHRPRWTGNGTTSPPQAYPRQGRAASPTGVVLKTSRGTRRLSRAVWTIAPIEGETRMPDYVPALLKEFAARDQERQRSTEKT
jgi:hypothetical protein